MTTPDNESDRYTSGDYLKSRLDQIFGQYAATLPDEDDEYAGTTDDVLRAALSPEEWATLEAHRERQAAEAIALHNSKQMQAAWAEADAAGVGLTWRQFQDRMTPAGQINLQVAQQTPEERAATRRERHTVIAHQAAEQARARYETDLRESLAGLPQETNE